MNLYARTDSVFRAERFTVIRKMQVIDSGCRAEETQVDSSDTRFAAGQVDQSLVDFFVDQTGY